MKRVLQRIGIIAWWVVLPGLIVYLHGKPRTRVLVRSRGKVVVVKGWLGNGKWSLPGGGLHKGEGRLAGALRELREETGMQLAAAQVRPWFDAPYRSRGISFPCHYFVVDLPEPVPLRRQLMEISELAWVDPAVLTPYNANADVLTALQRAAPNRP